VDKEKVFSIVAGDFSRKLPSFSVFGLLFGLFCCFGFYFSFEVVEWTSA